MLGERYVATRERLLEVMRRILTLATETGTDLDGHLSEKDIAQGLDKPFLFIAHGEVNSGKSTLFNGLFGRDFCKTSVLPETQRLLWYRYGNPARDVETAPMLHECERPLDFLRDFEVIDTPGTNSEKDDHQEITTRVLPFADLIFFVFSVTNPWSSATWNSLSQLSPECLKRVVLIVQQSDQRDAIELRVMLGHIADLSMKRLGFVAPVFAVSGKLACEAKFVRPLLQEALQQSGFPALERFISEQVCGSTDRKRILQHWQRKAAVALRSVEDQIEDQTRGINEQSRFIESIEREIREIRERFLIRLPAHLAGVAEVFETEAIWATKLLHRRLGVFPSLFRLFVGDRTGPVLESAFIQRLQAAVEAVAEKDGVEVVEVCRDHWKNLRQRVNEAMGIDIGNSQQLDAALAAAQQRFVQRLGQSARLGIGNLKVRNQLDKDLRRRNMSLRSFTATTLILTTLGAVSGALEIAWLPLIFCGLAGAFLVWGTITAWVTRRTITSEFQSRMLDTCGSFASTLLSDYEDALRIVFEDYSCSLSLVRTHLAREKLKIEPRLRLAQDLFLTLKAIEQDL